MNVRILADFVVTAILYVSLTAVASACSAEKTNQTSSGDNSIGDNTQGAGSGDGSPFSTGSGSSSFGAGDEGAMPGVGADPKICAKKNVNVTRKSNIFDPFSLHRVPNA